MYAYADVIFVRCLVFFFFFSRLGSVGQLLSAHDTHITITHYSHNSAPPTIRSDGFPCTTTSLCCCNAHSSRNRSNSSSTCCCNTRCCCNTHCCNTLYRTMKTPVQVVIFCGRIPRYSSHIPHPRFDIDTHDGGRRCKFRSKYVSCLGRIHEVAPAVPSAGRTRARTARCLRGRDGKGCRVYAHTGTKALIRHVHKASCYILHPRRFARYASYERSCFLRITTQAHTKKS